jgi:hypothetical protein
VIVADEPPDELVLWDLEGLFPLLLAALLVVEEEGTVRAGVPEFVFVFFAVDTFG